MPDKANISKEKLGKLKSLIELVDSSMTKAEFASVVKMLVQMLETRFKKDKAELEMVAAMVATKSMEKLKSADEEVKAKLAQVVSGKDGAKGEAGYTPVKGVDYFDGKDGVDGKDADEEEITQKAIASLEANLPMFGSKFRDGLELLKDEERLDASAIKGLEDVVRKYAPASSGRGGGTSAIGVAQAFKYIAHTEVPVGDIDGANTTYTVRNTIFWIAGFTLNGENIAELPNFTYSGRTITFATALPAAYSGKDFECKYIGV